MSGESLRAWVGARFTEHALAALGEGAQRSDLAALLDVRPQLVTRMAAGREVTLERQLGIIGSWNKLRPDAPFVLVLDGLPDGVAQRPVLARLGDVLTDPGVVSAAEGSAMSALEAATRKRGGTVPAGVFEVLQAVFAALR